jgi:hypothetical protein
MYLRSAKSTAVNDLGYKIFQSNNNEVSSGQLPLCKDALHRHTKRANYQADIWRRCLENSPTIPEAADEHGYGKLKGMGKLTLNG